MALRRLFSRLSWSLVAAIVFLFAAVPAYDASARAGPFVGKRQAAHRTIRGNPTKRQGSKNFRCGQERCLRRLHSHGRGLQSQRLRNGDADRRSRRRGGSPIAQFACVLVSRTTKGAGEIPERRVCQTPDHSRQDQNEFGRCGGLSRSRPIPVSGRGRLAARASAVEPVRFPDLA